MVASVESKCMLSMEAAAYPFARSEAINLSIYASQAARLLKDVCNPAFPIMRVESLSKGIMLSRYCDHAIGQSNNKPVSATRILTVCKVGFAIWYYWFLVSGRVSVSSFGLLV